MLYLFINRNNLDFSKGQALTLYVCSYMDNTRQYPTVCLVRLGSICIVHVYMCV